MQIAVGERTIRLVLGVKCNLLRYRIVLYYCVRTLFEGCYEIRGRGSRPNVAPSHGANEASTTTKRITGRLFRITYHVTMP